jgi:hypothetical protein
MTFERNPNRYLITISVDAVDKADLVEAMQTLLNECLQICGIEEAPTISIEEKPLPLRRLC